MIKVEENYTSQTIHANINGSLNIIRKVLLNFKFNKEVINIKYELMELNVSKKVKLNNFYKQSLIKETKTQRNKLLTKWCRLKFLIIF
jgi:CRISPR/Cas system-associated endonuclease Cas3-HD